MTLCAGVLLCECAPRRVQGPGPRLSEAAVLRMADAFARGRRGSPESFDPRYDPTREACFDPEKRVWWIHYGRNRCPNNHFSIRIDDDTEQRQYLRGA